MHSCIYRGYTTHHRLRPQPHHFRYPIAWLYLRLDEIPQLRRQIRLFSSSKWGVASFCACDHVPAEELAEFENDLQSALFAKVRAANGQATDGPVFVLTPLRHFGFYFSPLSLFFCWDAGMHQVPTVVAEVNNTPWRHKHWYVLSDRNAAPKHESSPANSEAIDADFPPESVRFSHEKEFHVSPFMDMHQSYHWSISLPTDRLMVSIRSTDANGAIFAAGMNLERQALNNWSFTRLVLRYPITPYQILATIYFEAFRLWRKNIPYFPNPATQ